MSKKENRIILGVIRTLGELQFAADENESAVNFVVKILSSVL